MFRSAIARTNARVVFASSSRTLHSSRVAAAVLPTDKVKEVADKVDKTLGKQLAAGIEKGEQATEKTKEVFINTKQKAQETTGSVQDKTTQAATGAKQGAQDFKKDVKEEVRK